jgi:hypothetical protein
MLPKNPYQGTDISGFYRSNIEHEPTCRDERRRDNGIVRTVCARYKKRSASRSATAVGRLWFAQLVVQPRIKLVPWDVMVSIRKYSGLVCLTDQQAIRNCQR